MCLLLLAYRAHPEVEILLAGNRDEFYRRPAQAPALVWEHPRIYAGLDREAGGTWMGRNEHGLVAALTNRRQPGFQPPPGVRSRGEIVMGLLRQPTVAAAREWLAGLPHRSYRPYSVLFGSRDGFSYFSPQDAGPAAAPSAVPALRALQPGFYCLSNSTLDDRSWPKVERAHRFFERHRHLPGEALLARLQEFFRDPTPSDTLPSADIAEEIHGAMGAVFIRTPEYGTVSSSIITLGGKLGARYYYAEAAAMLAAKEGGPAAFRLLELGT